MLDRLRCKVHSGRSILNFPGLLLSGLILFSVSSLEAQPIFEGQTGQTLITNLRASYLPSSVQSLAAAKDLIYGTIDRTSAGGQDGVYGIYTGFFVLLDGVPNTDPSQDVFNAPNENTQGINLEHVWPQSKGASSGTAQSNMYHLFPSKVNVNANRGNLPFAEIPDGSTTTWYRDADSQASIPTSAIDEYSELQSGTAFEPRESVKGDIARAMFYFYTMYGPSADAADPNFFSSQMATLRTWHVQDPVDVTESARNALIASYQDNKSNPFIDDPTLVDRAYFEQYLPIELESFRAISQAGAVSFRWVTLSESETSSFIVRLRADGIDEVTVSVDARGAPSRRTEYDTGPIRVKPGHDYQVSLLERTVTGLTILVAETAVRGATSTDVQIYPNPAVDYLSVGIPARGPHGRVVRIVDISGRVMARLATSGESSGLEFRTIDLTHFPNGVYFVVDGRRANSFVINR